MSTRLLSLLAVQWATFPAFAAEASPKGIEAMLAKFGAICEAQAVELGGAPVVHAVKDREERRMFSFAGPSEALAAAYGVRDALSSAGFPARLALHCGECHARGDTLLGAALHEVRELASGAREAALWSTEVFRLTLPAEAPVQWVRQEAPENLAGTAWTVYRADVAVVTERAPSSQRADSGEV